MDDLKEIQNQSGWKECDFRKVETLPPPFKRIEVETMPGALYPNVEWYTHCYGRRTGIHTLTVFYGHNESKELGFLAVKRWRIADETAFSD